MNGPYDWLDIRHFVQSEHPLVAEFFPWVEGWEFHVGESVESWDGSKKGKVSAVTDDGVVVELDTIPSVQEFVSWKVYKCWEPGDYVCAPHVGEEGGDGLVIGMKSNYIYAWLGHEDDDDGMGMLIEHRNLVHAVPRVDQIEVLLARCTEDAVVEAFKYAGKYTRMSDDNIAQEVAQYREFENNKNESLALSRTFTSPWKWWTICMWRGNQKGVHTLLNVTTGCNVL
ncbi:hypothetical protein E1B28_012623 [Marasmius oreades]|uniref:Uncharacterized protein n=1 Tax=Marasmius oreades TaxID=181124 RepID=A0A9P7UQ45_9AGAR|nr:uncharacterized protein E1B28_012623 [Marasmius oreades]KAG7088651.1 hypothetical protein E1B28_012623 [Marasmius oreades]